MGTRGQNQGGRSRGGQSNPAYGDSNRILTSDDIAEAEERNRVGQKQMSSRDYNGAIKSFGQAIRIDRDNAEYYVNRAAAYATISDFECAVEDAEKAVELDTSLEKAYQILG